MSGREWSDVLRRAARETAEDHLVLVAKALAFSAFLAIPSALLVVAGVLGLAVDPRTVSSLVAHLHAIMPGQAVKLLLASLRRLQSRPGTSLLISLVGFGFALWATSSAMTSYMTALDMAYDREDRRGFLRRRLVALQMGLCLALSLVALAAILVFGTRLAHSIGTALTARAAINALWAVLRWPLAGLGLLPALAALLYLGPDVERRNWRLATPGALVAALAWITSGAALALYASGIGSYDRAWGSLASVIVLLTWLWFASLALLFGAELDSELDAGEGTRTPTSKLTGT